MKIDRRILWLLAALNAALFVGAVLLATRTIEVARSPARVAVDHKRGAPAIELPASSPDKNVSR